MCQIALNIPEAVLYDTKMNPTETSETIKKAIALLYYTKYGVSLGYCSLIAGMDKEDFIRFLGENKISIFQFDDEAEFIEEMNNA